MSKLKASSDLCYIVGAAAATGNTILFTLGQYAPAFYSTVALLLTCLYYSHNKDKLFASVVHKSAAVLNSFEALTDIIDKQPKEVSQKIKRDYDARLKQAQNS